MLGLLHDHVQLDAVGSPPPAGDSEELIVTGGIDDVVKIWRYRFPFTKIVGPIKSREKGGWNLKLFVIDDCISIDISIIRDGGLSVKHELRDHSLGVVSVTLSSDGSRLASRFVCLLCVCCFRSYNISKPQIN